MKLVWTLFGVLVSCLEDAARVELRLLNPAHRIGLLGCGSTTSRRTGSAGDPSVGPWLDAEQSRAGINDTSTPSTRAATKIPLDPLVASGRTLLVVTRSRTYQIKDVAQLAGVSVRTLHHYDSIGLLVPQARTAAGYRLYTDTDLFRLQQILIGRELGLSLEEIRRVLDDPRFDRKTALLDQRERLIARVRQTEAMIRAIDAALAGVNGDQKDAEKMEDLFEGFDRSRYEDEVRQRWGTSEAFLESEKRTRRYTPDDWKALKAEQAAVYDDAHSALQAGQRPSDEAVMEIAERHRLSIDRWFYPCSHRMHCGLAALYESDDRFRQAIDRHGQGLTSFFAEAIRANSARHQD